MTPLFTDDPIELADARDLATECERREVNWMLENQSQLIYTTRWQLARLRRAGTAAKNLLASTVRRADCSMEQRCGAAIALLTLDEPEAAALLEELVDSITTPDMALKFISAVDFRIEYIESNQAELVRQSAILKRWLLSWTTHVTTRIAAASLCDNLGIPVPPDQAAFDPESVQGNHALYMESRRCKSNAMLLEIVRRLKSEID